MRGGRKPARITKRPGLLPTCEGYEDAVTQWSNAMTRRIGNFPGIPILEADQTQLVQVKTVRASDRIKDMRWGLQWISAQAARVRSQ